MRSSAERPCTRSVRHGLASPSRVMTYLATTPCVMMAGSGTALVPGWSVMTLVWKTVASLVWATTVARTGCEPGTCRATSTTRSRVRWLRRSSSSGCGGAGGGGLACTAAPNGLGRSSGSGAQSGGNR